MCDAFTAAPTDSTTPSSSTPAGDGGDGDLNAAAAAGTGSCDAGTQRALTAALAVMVVLAVIAAVFAVAMYVALLPLFFGVFLFYVSIINMILSVDSITGAYD